MGKYLAVFRLHVQNTLTFRGPLFVWIFSSMITLFSSVYVWMSASGGKTFGGYSQNEIITYYILVMLMGWVVNWMPFYPLKEDIANGTVATKNLIKPISLYFEYFSSEAGWRIVAIWWGLLGSAIFVYFFQNNFVFFTPTPVNSILIILTIILAIFVTFSMSIVMGLVAFWLTNIDVLDNFYWICRMVFGGLAIPITFFTGWMSVLSFVLPFRYMMSFPLEIYFGKLNIDNIFQGIGIEIVWIVIFVILYKIMLSRGLKKFSAFGG